MSTDVLTKDDVETDPTNIYTGSDPSKFAHYLKKEFHAAYVTGDVVEALCGYKWVPSRDPKNRPICPDCDFLYNNIVPE